MYGNTYYGTVEIPFILSKAGEHVARTAGHIIQKQQGKLQEVYRIVEFILDKAQKEGLLALEDSLRYIRISRVPFADFLADYILLIVDGTDSNLILEMMANEFIVRQPDDFGMFVLYLYVVTIITAQQKSRYDMVLYREKAWKELVRIRNEYIVFLPRECRKLQIVKEEFYGN